MKTGIKELHRRWERLTERAELRKDQLDAALEPIINIISPDAAPYEIRSIDIDKENWLVGLSWWCRGHETRIALKIPVEVIDSPDPIEAAKSYAAKMAKDAARNRDRQLKADLAVIQLELRRNQKSKR